MKKNIFTEIPHAILFDTDNTLYAYDPAHHIAMSEVQKSMEVKLNIKKGDFEKTFTEARKQIKSRLKGQASSHSRLLYFQRFYELMGLGTQILLSLETEQVYWRSFLNHAVLFDGVLELLDDIRLLGIPTAVVTDLTTHIQFRKLIHFGLDEKFDFIVTSEEAGFDKPHAAPYELTIEKLNPKGKCIWMIGDHPINDIRGAREKINAITLQKIHPGSEESTGEHKADYVFNEFSELRKLLSHLAAQAQ